MEKINKVLNRIYDLRYYICISIFIVCTIFNISGSSVASWKDYINYGQESGTLLGVSRPIRSDEWAVYLALLESQAQGENNFPYVSNIISSESTDMFIVYGQPVFDISMIFRIFHIGYLIFGIDKGLSIFWIARLIVLFLVSIEFMKILTKQNKLLSVTAAIMLTFAPVIQWWFAINGLVEMLIYMQLSIIMLKKYMNENSLIKRLLYLIVIAISAGGYILTFYPAWEIPFAYVTIALAIWTIKENYKNCKITKKDISMIVIVLMVFAILMAYIGIKSKDTIATVLNSDYPGSRVETGGGMIKKYFQSTTNVFFPFIEKGTEDNACAEAIFIDAFPIGLILSLLVIFKEKKKDFALIILSILGLFIGVYCIFGLPEILSKLTMLSVSPSKRTIVIASFINFLIYIRSLALIKESIEFKKSVVISFVLSILVTLICKLAFYSYLTKFMLFIMTIILFGIFYLSLRFKEKNNKYFLVGLLIFISLIGGITVNPVQSGTQVIYNTTLANEIKKINNEDKATWIVEGLGLPMINYPIMMGAKTVNCTNVYPHLDLWEKLDPKNEYKEIYNRYAHIGINITENENKFELARKDVFYAYITVDKIEIFDAKYILTVHDLEMFNTDEIKFKKKYEDNLNYRIYEIQYIK